MTLMDLTCAAAAVLPAWLAVQYWLMERRHQKRVRKFLKWRDEP